MVYLRCCCWRKPRTRWRLGGGNELRMRGREIRRLELNRYSKLIYFNLSSLLRLGWYFGILTSTITFSITWGFDGQQMYSRKRRLWTKDGNMESSQLQF